jgi:hypothetical protein
MKRTLKVLPAEDVATLIEQTIQGIRRKLASGHDAILATERNLDSELSQRIFDLVREYDIAADIANRER